MDIPALVGPQELAEILGLSVNTIYVYHSRHDLPEATMVSGRPVWTADQIRPYIEEREARKAK